MRKIIFVILLSVMLTGCGKAKETGITETSEEAIPTEEKTTEPAISEDITTTEEITTEDAAVMEITSEDVTTEEITEDITTEQTVIEETTEDVGKTENDASDTAAQEEMKEPVGNADNNVTEPEEKPQTTEEAKKEESGKKKDKQKPKKYDADKVARMAVKMCEAEGMITIEDNLKKNLKKGKITQEEYDEYYPLDGMEDSYYSVFINVDLNKAATVSGRLLESEKGIAEHLAGMMLLEDDPIFEIKCVGTYKTKNEEYYEFRCYR